MAADTPPRSILGFLVAMNLLIDSGNSYIRSERALFGSEARLDQIRGRPGDVVNPIVAVGCLDNLRPALQAPPLLALLGRISMLQSSTLFEMLWAGSGNPTRRSFGRPVDGYLAGFCYLSLRIQGGGAGQPLSLPAADC